MPKTISVSAATTPQGGLVLVSGDEWLLQLIMTAVSANESDNPWNYLDIHPGEDMIFSINDSSAASNAEQRIKDLFSSLEAQNFAKLTRIRINPSKKIQGELHAFITYLNIESDSDVEVDVPLS